MRRRFTCLSCGLTSTTFPFLKCSPNVVFRGISVFFMKSENRMILYKRVLFSLQNLKHDFLSSEKLVERFSAYYNDVCTIFSFAYFRSFQVCLWMTDPFCPIFTVTMLNTNGG